MESYLAWRTNTSRYFPNQAKVRLTRHAPGILPPKFFVRPLRFFRGGMHEQTRFRRSHLRNGSESYARSATNLAGRFRGRPRLRETRILSRVPSPNFTSAQLARANKKASGIPFPSVASIRFVPLPAFISPISSPLFLLEQNSHPARLGLFQLPFFIQLGKEGLPHLLPYPFLLQPLPPFSTRSHKLRTPVTCPSSDNRSATRTKCHLPPYGHPPLDDPSFPCIGNRGQICPTAPLLVHSPQTFREPDSQFPC